MSVNSTSRSLANSCLCGVFLLLVGTVTTVACSGCSKAPKPLEAASSAGENAGLTMSLILDEPTVSQDGWLGFTVELTNTGTEPITVEMWLQDHDALEIRDEAGQVKALEWEIDYEQLAREDFYTLGARESIGVGGGIGPEREYELTPGRYRMLAIYKNSPLVAAYDRQDLRDLAVTEGLPEWGGTSVRSNEVTFRVTPPTGETLEARRRAREAEPELGLSVSLSADRGVVPEDGALRLAVKLTDTGREAITVGRWRPEQDTVEIRDAKGHLRPLQHRQESAPTKRRDFYTPGEWVVFRSSISPADYGLEPGEYRLTAIYPPTPLIVESPERMDLSETEDLQCWTGAPIRSNEVTFRVE